MEWLEEVTKSLRDEAVALPTSSFRERGFFSSLRYKYRDKLVIFWVFFWMGNLSHQHYYCFLTLSKDNTRKKKRYNPLKIQKGFSVLATMMILSSQLSGALI